MSDPDVQSLRDRLDLQDLIHRYAFAVDEHDRGMIRALFAEDAVLAVADVNEPSGYRLAVRGRDEIADLIARLADPGGEHFPGPTAHVIGAHVVSVNGDTGRGDTRCVAHHLSNTTGELLHRTSFLRYRDTFSREIDGWKIQLRVLLHDFVDFQPFTGDVLRQS